MISICVQHLTTHENFRYSHIMMECIVVYGKYY